MMGCPFLISKDPKPPISYCRILPLNPKPYTHKVSYNQKRDYNGDYGQ